MSAVTWDPDIYPTTIREEIHDYEELQERVVAATLGIEATDVLELGIGAGETAARILEAHPEAQLLGIDSSPEMLRGAAEVLPGGRFVLLEQDLRAPLPERSFDLIVSALAIHHLQGEGKARLFRDIAHHLVPAGRFVMGDVIVPEDPADALIENEEGYDFPSTVEDQLGWLTEAGFTPEVVWLRQDLAVLRADRAP